MGLSSMRLRQPGRTVFALKPSCADAAMAVSASAAPNSDAVMRVHMIAPF
jgi:hypothetical protein